MTSRIKKLCLELTSSITAFVSVPSLHYERAVAEKASPVLSPWKHVWNAFFIAELEKTL